MSRTSVATPVAPSPGTASQQARRERIVKAALELASEGGFDAVQMRDVAERADVALGTLYRYFPSKGHLLVSGLRVVFERLRDGVREPAPQTPPRDRVVLALTGITRALSRERKLSGALVRALITADPSVHNAEETRDLLVQLIASATHDGAEPDDQDFAIADIIGKVWLLDLVWFLSGRKTLNEVLRDLERTVDLLLPDPRSASRTPFSGAGG